MPLQFAGVSWGGGGGGGGGTGVADNGGAEVVVLRKVNDDAKVEVAALCDLDSL